MNEHKWGDGASLNPDKILDYVMMAFDAARERYLINDPPEVPNGFEEKYEKTIERIYDLLLLEKALLKGIEKADELEKILSAAWYWKTRIEEGQKELSGHGVDPKEYPTLDYKGKYIEDRKGEKKMENFSEPKDPKVCGDGRKRPEAFEKVRAEVEMIRGDSETLKNTVETWVLTNPEAQQIDCAKRAAELLGKVFVILEDAYYLL